MHQYGSSRRVTVFEFASRGKFSDQPGQPEFIRRIHDTHGQWRQHELRNYDWDIGGAIQTNGIEVEVQLNNVGTDLFEVCLEVTDELNCTAVECRSIALDEGITAYAPNAFSPDQDGRNDAWKIVCNDAVKSFELHIFDRWGNVVFETQDKHAFWMGDVNGGTHFAANGIYFYRAVLRGDNYEVRSMEGSIALIR